MPSSPLSLFFFDDDQSQREEWTWLMLQKLIHHCECFGLYAPFNSETDPGFREEITRLSRMGMRLASFLAIIGPPIGIGLNLLISHQHIVLFGPESGSIPIFAPVVIFAIGVLGLILSRFSFGQRHGRTFVAIFLGIMMSGMSIEGVLGLTSPSPYDGTSFAILMLIGIGTMPYRAWHTVALGTFLTLTYLLTMSMMPQVGLVGAMSVLPLILSFVVMLTVFGALISGMIYSNRWRHYIANRRQESLREEIAASESQYRSLFESASDGILVIDNNTSQFKQANPSLVEMLGIPESELCTMPFTDVIDPSDRQRVTGYHLARLDGKPAPSRYVLKVLSRSEPEPLIAEITIHRSSDPSVTRAAVRDVTKQSQAAERIRIYAEQLEEANTELRDAQLQLVQSEKMAALGTLVAGVAHEINTPIGSIHSNADLSRRALEIVRSHIETDADNPTERRIAVTDKLEQALGLLASANDTTCTATERIVAIVRSLRNFARLDEAELKEVDLHEGIESTLTLTYHEFKHRITIERDYGQLPLVSCYPNQLNQVFMNLLVNAIHAIEEEGTITITTRAEDQRVRISFADTGMGIPETNLARIFDPGFTTKGVGVGTGLGLSIVYKIIKEHNGTIDVDSEVGVGTTFTITLPTGSGQTESG